MAIDSVLRMVGSDITILRDSGNVSTYGRAEITGIETGKRILEPVYDFITVFRMPSDSDIVSGDLLEYEGEFYLTMSIEPKKVFRDVMYKKCVMYKCNTVASIYYHSDVTKKHDDLHKSGVHCLITQVRAKETAEDKTLIVANYKGTQQPFQVFAQESSGITKKSIIVDQAGRRFRLGKDFDPFISAGILQSEVKWETV